MDHVEETVEPTEGFVKIGVEPSFKSAEEKTGEGIRQHPGGILRINSLTGLTSEENRGLTNYDGCGGKISYQ